MSSVEINKPIVIKEFESSYPLSLAKEDVDYIRNIVQEGDEKKIDLIQHDEKYIIKAKNFVGTIPLKYSTYPQLIINPKAGQLNFYQMWGFTENIKTAKLFDTVDISEGNSLADLMAKPFLDTVNPIIEEGIFKNYVTNTEQIPAIKCRLLLSQNIRGSHITQEKFWCEFDDLTADILENQILLYCSKLLASRLTDTKYKQKLYYFQHRLEMEGVSDVPLEPYHLDSISIQKLNQHYNNALDFCEFILRYFGYGFQIDTKIPGSGHLYNMNNLFQDFVTKILQKNLPSIYQVYKEEKKKDFLIDISNQNENLDGVSRFSTDAMKPDIIIKKNGEDKLIIDTKYKETTSKGDYYQGVSYSLYSKCPILLLLPQIKERKGTDFEINKEKTEQDAKIFVRTIDFEYKQSINYIHVMKDRILETVQDIFDLVRIKPSILSTRL